MQDVNKICVICYVLPTADAPQQTAPPDTINTVGEATHIAEDESMCEGSGNSNSAVVMADCITKTETPTVSPYLATLFPTASNTSTSTTTNTTRIDRTSHTCLSALTVRPVTALVRRMPALCETHQTIKMIQEAYHAASTAQKKRELKALNKAKFGKNNSTNTTGGGGGGGGHKKYSKPYTRVSASADTTNPPPTITSTNTTTASTLTPTTTTITSTTTDTNALLTVDPATLSGRQKRIVKFLQKEALRSTTTTTLTSALPKSKQMKERRDHRENRTKVMSNKNQSLLNMMQGHDNSSSGSGGGSGSSGGSGSGDGRSSSNRDAGVDGKAEVSGGVDGNRGVSNSKNTVEVGAVPVDCGSADTAGVKRRHGDVNTYTGDSSALSFFSTLFYSPKTTANTTTETTSDSEGSRKRCRTQYTQGGGTTAAATDGAKDKDDGYLRRAASYCVIS